MTILVPQVMSMSIKPIFLQGSSRLFTRNIKIIMEILNHSLKIDWIMVVITHHISIASDSVISVLASININKGSGYGYDGVSSFFLQQCAEILGVQYFHNQ